MGVIVGFDTSCYTTSAAAVDTDGVIVASERRLLSVPIGERGLRQSEALFQHVRVLPELIRALMDGVGSARVEAVCVSSRPRPQEDSYMPVFLAGVLAGRAMAEGLCVPCFETSHQLGHVFAGRYGLDVGPHIALHLSGGTTEILFVDGEDIKLLGGTNDLHVGQFVDRVGVALGLEFPAGPSLEALALDAGDEDIAAASGLLAVSVKGTEVSFSGAESQASRLIKSGKYPPRLIARAVFSCLVKTVRKLIDNIGSEMPRDVILVGGVSGSVILRNELKKDGANFHFAMPQLSGDNAVGTALVGLKRFKEL